MTALLLIDRVTCSVNLERFRTFRGSRKTVLNEVILEIKTGEVVGLLGESGSGKSTLARCIAGLQSPDGGRITFDSYNIFPLRTNLRRIRGDIQMVFQAVSSSLDPTMTIHDCLAEGVHARSPVPKNDAPGIIKNLLEKVDLSQDILIRRPDEISRGQRQRVCIARALAARPRLLILDEPTSALDVLTQQQILSLLKNLQREYNISMLFITHDLGVAMAVCDRIAVLHGGTIVEESTPLELLSSPTHPYTQRLVKDYLFLS